MEIMSHVKLEQHSMDSSREFRNEQENRPTRVTSESRIYPDKNVKYSFPSEIHAHSIVRDVSKLNALAQEVPYCMFRACQAQEHIVLKDDQESLFSFGSCIVYLTAFCARQAVENASWFRQHVLVGSSEGVIATEVWQETLQWIQRIGNLWREHVPARHAIDVCEGAKGISMIPGLQLSAQMLDMVRKTPSMTEWLQREVVNNSNKTGRWSEQTLICTLEWCVNRDPGSVLRYCVEQVCKDMPSGQQYLGKRAAKRSKKSAKRVKMEDSFDSSQPFIDEDDCTDTEQEEQTNSITPYHAIPTSFDAKVVPAPHMDTEDAITVTRRGEARNFMQKRKRTDMLGSPSFMFDNIKREGSDHVYVNTSSTDSLCSYIPGSSKHISNQKYYSLNATTEARIYCVTHVVLVCSEYGTRPILSNHCSALQQEQHAVLLGRWLLELAQGFPHTHVLNREIVVEIAASLVICKHNGVILAPAVLRAQAQVVEILTDAVSDSDINQRSNGPVAKTSTFLPVIANTQSKNEKGALFAQYHTNYLVGMFLQLIVVDSFGGLGRANYSTGEVVNCPAEHVALEDPRHSKQFALQYPKLPMMCSDYHTSSLPTPEPVESLSVRRKDALLRRKTEDQNHILLAGDHQCSCLLCSGDIPVLPRDCAAQQLSQCVYTTSSEIPTYLHHQTIDYNADPTQIYHGVPVSHASLPHSIHNDVSCIAVHFPPPVTHNMTRFTNTLAAVKNRTQFWPHTYNQPASLPLIPTGVGSYQMAMQRYVQSQSFAHEREFQQLAKKRTASSIKSPYPFVHIKTEQVQ